MQGYVSSALAGELVRRLLDDETRALLTRLERVKPFVLYETMVPAAAPPLGALTAIERLMMRSRQQLRGLAHEFLHWLHGPEARCMPASEAQRRYAFLRLRFNDTLTQFDVFADVITQRSEHDNGVWLAGLDDVAADALTLPGDYFTPPPLVCYLERGHGAAIRRARTRLPGGGTVNVGIVQVPRERMVGSGIASSLVHEVGHQASALLGLVPSLRPILKGLQRGGGPEAIVWSFWERWVSEIVADLWAVAKVGVAGTLGLMGVVSLPRPFVFRVSLDDPHPVPWIRVKLSAAMGDALYPDPQWRALAAVWDVLYPTAGLSEGRIALLAALERGMPAFISVLLNHRPRLLRGRSLREVLADPERQPQRLRGYFDAWGGSRLALQSAPPSLVFAVLGQARADGRLSPEQESRMVADLLRDWAMRSALDTSAICAALPDQRTRALDQLLRGSISGA